MTQFAKKIKLTNGLTVIFERNTAADIVSLNIGVKVGSANETNDESGICHLIEHMVFKGTKTYQAGEIATLVEANGGELNAYTSLDQTVYYINLPSKGFHLGLNILKEMAFDAAFDEVELEREKEVVVEEIRRGKDNPQRVLGELLFKSFFKQSPYRRPVIGTEAHVRGFSRDKIFSFYKKYYRPQNMILGVCGNITEAELSEQLEKLFRFEISSPEIHPQVFIEPEKASYKVVTESMEIQSTFFDVAFHAPNVSHEDVPALDILSHLLGEGETSLLEQNTKEKEQLVHYIYSSAYTPKSSGLFVIGGMVDHTKINEALASIRRQIEHVRTNLFENEKVERVKLLAEAQRIFGKETSEGTARKWMTYETVVGDYQFEEKYIEKILELTPLDLLKVAQKYLDVTKSTVIVLHPKGVKVKVDKNFFRKSIRTPKKNYHRLSRFKDVEVYELKNGVRVVLKENHRLPITAVRMTALGGLRFEEKSNNGISSLIAHTMMKGSKHYSQLQIGEKCEQMAANLSGYAGRNSWGGSFSTLSEKLREGLPFFCDVILNPTFDKEELEKEKRLQLESIKNREDNPSQLAFAGALKKVFAGHPFQMHSSGEANVLKRLTQQKLHNFYESLRIPNNMVVSAVGDFKSQEVLDILDAEFSLMPSGKLPKKSIAKPKAIKKVEKVFQLKNKKQAHLVVGFLGTSIYNEDRYVLDVINSLLSGQGGRLFLELRDKQSLAYTVTSTMIEGVDTGFFGFYIGTEPSKIPLALEGIFNEIEKLVTKKIPKVELDRAKNYILGNHEIDHQRNGSIAMQLALNELYGLGTKEFFDFKKHIQKVKVEDVRRVAKKYFNLDKCVISIVGPKEAKVF